MAKTLVYKFGGASVKDSDSVKNLLDILRNRLRKNMILVVSAMGKTTNALEEILLEKLRGEEIYKKSTILMEWHLAICRELFKEGHSVFAQVENLFSQLHRALELPLSKQNYDEFYDRVVSFGELVSSKIVAEFLCDQGQLVIWKDVREVIRTDSGFRFAQVDWPGTTKNCISQWEPVLVNFPIVTQGFIARDPLGNTTTLGREGSDFTAAILGTCLRASSVTIWKDVPGVLNADPRLFSQTRKFEELSYQEAAEMTYFGASVIHPKTIKPLANAGIPLYVKSFLNPEEPGTKIHRDASAHQIPTWVLKKNQLLVSFKVTDFTFIEEAHIHKIYERLQQLKLRVNMLQLSAISVSLVIDSQLFKLEQLLLDLRDEFEIRYNEGLELLTVLHPNSTDTPAMEEGYETLLEQSTRNTIQVVRRKI